ncbi:Beta-1,2-xylosyltransferase 1 [Tolypocladium ophioglossoides CBS 100239]|uniref:Beta-1,2-xylosyltransferase 1 n=1 Tax=Tolypocladium ophioglossoides (strain CBS 100239) TaxID=1163406 RepID=A0A0L0MYP5_TOLOC|nr:Beta-1,2-xylosyltransferase 1 [Tolypocladium ophioglossoides CBS 100239]
MKLRQWRQAFLPFFSLICELIIPNKTKNADLGTNESSKTTRVVPSPLASIQYAILALGWATSSMSALALARVKTGTVCPVGWQWGGLTKCAQATICALDAVTLTCGAQLYNHEAETNENISELLATILVIAAGCVLLLAFPFWLIGSSFYLVFKLQSLDVWDLLLDSLVASTALLSGLSLLADFHPTSVALFVSEVGSFGYWYPSFKFARAIPAVSLDEFVRKSLLATMFAGLLWRLAVSPSYPPRTHVSRLHRWLFLFHAGIVVFTVVSWRLLSTTSIGLPISQAIEKLVSSARIEKAAWDAQAASSQTLSDAVVEYKKRYGMPPPPNFDKWYEFAIECKSSVIDDFGQIHDDILPFWGVEPSKIRERTAQLMEYANIEMGGLSIQNGTVYQSPHIPGTHRWMTDSLEKMIEPFAKWLPDMVLAINLADECRVAVPFQDMQALKATAKDAISRVVLDNIDGTTKQASSGPDVGQGWAFGFPEPKSYRDPSNPGQVAPAFTDYHGKQIYYDWIAATCPPNSVARNSRWWDWSTLCSSCLAPHSLMTCDGAIVANTTLAHNLCHQPDVAYLDGFLMSPAVMVGSTSLFPVFSQARVGGFSDVLIPSPWDFNENSAYTEQEDMAWAEKTNGLYWRGSSSDGFAAHSLWAGFLRARFVHEAYDMEVRRSEKADTQDSLHINVSFVGGMSRCAATDCATELDSFRRWSTITTTQSGEGSVHDYSEKKATASLPPVLPFGENWRFRHLMDMDGAGFSGRFRSFMQSRSLVYRAAFFRTWYDERILAWHDYIPIDVRLGSGLWSVLDYLAGGPGTKLSSSDSQGGSETAQKVADQGRNWALKALRREHMQVYMFRLLLEWGRVTNDARETLVYDTK